MFLNLFIRQNVPIALNFSVEFHKKRIYFVLSLTGLSVLRGIVFGGDAAENTFFKNWVSFADILR